MLAALAACSFNETKLTDGGPPAGDGNQMPVECVDSLEPNETTQQATIADLAMSPVSFTDLALCPATDEDFFFLPLETGNQAIEVTLTRDGGPAGIEVSLLNAGGAKLELGTDSGFDTSLCLDNAPMGVYFVNVSKATDTRYRITFTTQPNCPAGLLHDLGRMTGLEPATSWTTTRRSTN